MKPSRSLGSEKTPVKRSHRLKILVTDRRPSPGGPRLQVERGPPIVPHDSHVKERTDKARGSPGHGRAKFTIALTIPVRAAQSLSSFGLDPDREKAIMSLDRIPGQLFGALVNHANGRRGRSCLRDPPGSPLLGTVLRPSTGSTQPTVYEPILVSG